MQGHEVHHLTFRPAADGSLHVHASPSTEQPGNTHTLSARTVEPQPVMWVCFTSCHLLGNTKPLVRTPVGRGTSALLCTQVYDAALSAYG